MASTQAGVPALQVPAADQEMDLLSDGGRSNTDRDYDMLGSYDQDIDYMIEDSAMEPSAEQHTVQNQEETDDIFLEDVEGGHEGMIEKRPVSEEVGMNDELLDYSYEFEEHEDTVGYTAEDTTRTDFGDDTFLTAYEEPAEAHPHAAVGDFHSSGEHTIVDPGRVHAEEYPKGNTESNTSLALPTNPSETKEDSHNTDDRLDHSSSDELAGSLRETNKGADREQGALETTVSNVAPSPHRSSEAQETRKSSPQDNGDQVDLEHQESLVSNVARHGTTARDESVDFHFSGLDEQRSQQRPARAADDLHESQDAPEIPTVIMHYQDEEYSLFPPSTQYPSLSEFSDWPPALHSYDVARKSLGHLFAALRKEIGEDISDDEYLELSVEQLDLTLREGSPDCSTCTFEQLASIYHTLNANDNEQNMQRLDVHISKCPKFSARLSALQQAVNDQLGYSQVDFLQHVVHEDYSGVYEGGSTVEDEPKEQSACHSPANDGDSQQNAEQYYNEDGGDAANYHGDESPEDLDQLEEEHVHEHEADQYQLDEFSEAQHEHSHDEEQLAPIPADQHRSEAGDSGEFTALVEEQYDLYDFGDEDEDRASGNAESGSTTIQGDEFLEAEEEAIGAQSSRDDWTAPPHGDAEASEHVVEAAQNMAGDSQELEYQEGDGQYAADENFTAFDEPQQQPFDLTVTDEVAEDDGEHIANQFDENAFVLDEDEYEHHTFEDRAGQTQESYAVEEDEASKSADVAAHGDHSYPGDAAVEAGAGDQGSPAQDEHEELQSAESTHVEAGAPGDYVTYPLPSIDVFTKKKSFESNPSKGMNSPRESGKSQGKRTLDEAACVDASQQEVKRVRSD